MEPTFPKGEASADVVGCIQYYLSRMCKQVDDFVELTEQEAERWLAPVKHVQCFATL